MDKYIYTFVIHLSPEHLWNKNIRQLVSAILTSRTELITTQQEFNELREIAFKEGFEFMEIERIPYFPPETVI